MPKQLACSAFIERALKQFPQLWGVKDRWEVYRGNIDRIKIQRADRDQTFRFLLKKTARGGQMWIFLLLADEQRLNWRKRICELPEDDNSTWHDQVAEAAFHSLPGAYSYVEAVVYYDYQTFTIFRPPTGRKCLNAYIGELRFDIPLADLCDPVYSCP